MFVDGLQRNETAESDDINDCYKTKHLCHISNEYFSFATASYSLIVFHGWLRHFRTKDTVSQGHVKNIRGVPNEGVALHVSNIFQCELITKY